MKRMKALVALGLFVAVATLVPVYAQEPAGGIKITSTAYHITTNTTNTPVADGVAARIYAIVVNTSNAGTSWTLSVKTKEATPKILVNALTLATSQNPLVISFAPYGISTTDGLDVITAGSAAGVADVWVVTR